MISKSPDTKINIKQKKKNNTTEDIHLIFHNKLISYPPSFTFLGRIKWTSRSLVVRKTNNNWSKTPKHETIVKPSFHQKSYG